MYAGSFAVSQLKAIIISLKMTTSFIAADQWLSNGIFNTSRES